MKDLVNEEGINEGWMMRRNILINSQIMKKLYNNRKKERVMRRGGEEIQHTEK
jgi:hypothetical protein